MIVSRETNFIQKWVKLCESIGVCSEISRTVKTHDSHTVRQCWYVKKAGQSPRRFDGRRQWTQNALWTLLGTCPGIRMMTDGDNMGDSQQADHNQSGGLAAWVSKAHQRPPIVLCYAHSATGLGCWTSRTIGSGRTG